MAIVFIVLVLELELSLLDPDTNTFSNDNVVRQMPMFCRGFSGLCREMMIPAAEHVSR